VTVHDAGRDYPEASPEDANVQRDATGTVDSGVTRNACLSILSLGHPASYGADSGDRDKADSFESFMNDHTGGTATMQMLKTFSHIGDLRLDDFDLIILQALYTDNPYDPASTLWKYTDADAAALRTWVENGGAVIAMSGYFTDNTAEIQPLNQLLKPLGIAYNGDDIYTRCPDELCYCTDNSIPFGNWNQDFTEITHDLRYVGVFHGRSIECTDCQVMATDSTSKLKMGVSNTVGKGRVFAWSDEWVTYTSQWGLADSKFDDPQNTQCSGHTAKTMYSVPQFWYNVIHWAAPTKTCFTIVLPPDAPPGQEVFP
jgi:hypothetical protein